jgi:hypothetical protein
MKNINMIAIPLLSILLITGCGGSDTVSEDKKQDNPAQTQNTDDENNQDNNNKDSDTPDPDTLAPSKPGNVKVTGGEEEITISWDTVTGADSYNLYLASDSSIGPSNYNDLTGGQKIENVSSPYTVSSLSNGTTYYAVVTAVNKNGESSASSRVDSTPEFLGGTVRHGDILHANTHTEKDQEDARVSMSDNGNLVVIWQSTGQEIETYRINMYGQVFTADGVKIGSEFRINEELDHSSLAALSYDVSMNASGDFVVAWGAEKGSDGRGVYARLYNADGSAKGQPFLVDKESDAWTHSQTTVEMKDDGGFVVVYQFEAGFTTGYKAKIYDSNGTAGNSFWITDEGGWSRPAVAEMDIAANGDFVVTWRINDFDHEIMARAFSSNGTPKGPSWQVNTTDGDNPQKAPDIAMLSDGRFVIVWQSKDTTTNTTQVFGQKYNADTSKDGGEFRISTYDEKAQEWPTVVADGDRFFVAWSGYGANGKYDDVYGQWFEFSTGNRINDEFRLNIELNWRQRYPVAAISSSGKAAVFWSDNQIEDDEGIYGQVLNTP